MNDFFDAMDDRLPDNLKPLVLSAIAALIVLVLAALLYSLVVRSLAMLHRQQRLSEATYFLLRRILRWIFVPVVLLLMLQQFNVLENVWATLTTVLAMVAIGFVAVWSVLSNIFCSLVLMITRPFSVGDTIDVPSDNLQGKVIDFNLMFTTLRDEQGDLIQIPNNLFFQKPIRRRVGTVTIPLEEQVEREAPAE